MKNKIEEFKEKANRPEAADEDVKKLLNACDGDVNLAVSLIVDYDKAQIPRKVQNTNKIHPTILSYNPRDCETKYECVCGYRFDSWDLFCQKKNANGTGKYCPGCKRELEI